MKRHKPAPDRIAYLIGGAPFPADGAAVNPFEPFYARQIAEGGLTEAGAAPAPVKARRAATPKAKD